MVLVTLSDLIPFRFAEVIPLTMSDLISSTIFDLVPLTFASRVRVDTDWISNSIGPFAYPRNHFQRCSIGSKVDTGSGISRVSKVPEF